MSKLFIPHVLKTIEVDTEKKIFRINGEDFGKGCTGFRIECRRYDEFDIRVEVDTTIHLVTIQDGRCADYSVHKTNDPWYKPEATCQEESDGRDQRPEQSDQVE